MKRLCACVAAVLCASLAAAEEERDRPVRPNELQLRTERVVVFKDGYCLVVKQAVAETDAAGEVYTECVPEAAVLGSFWAMPKEGRLLSMEASVVTTSETTKAAAPCLQYLELLKANAGKACTIELTDGKTLSGTIREVLAQETKAPVAASAAPDAYLSHRPHLSSAWRGTFPPPEVSVTGLAGTLFVMQTDSGDMVLPVTDVRRLTIKGVELKTERTTTTTRRAKRLTFRLEGAKKKQELLLMYFTPGMRWIPAYRVEAPPANAEKQEARIALQAEILNEVEDLDGVPVDIVVGVPNFRFKTVVSPFSLEAALRNALEQAAPQLMGQFRNDQVSNALFSQRAGEWRREQAEQAARPEAGTLNLPAELTAGGAQDLFIYNLPPLKLKKGARAAVPIFEATAACRHVYTWDVRLQRHDIEAAPSGAGQVSPLVLAQNQVWHQLELTNNTNVPWTTGAAMLLEGRQVLAQELLTYTAPGDSVRVPVTVSVDTRGTFSEKETARTLNALQWNHSTYARIEKEGALVLTNLKKSAVDVEIVCSLGGRATEASDGGKITLGTYDAADWVNYHGDPAVNNHARVTWRVQVKPGETFAPKVMYHYFTRQ